MVKSRKQKLLMLKKIKISKSNQDDSIRWIIELFYVFIFLFYIKNYKFIIYKSIYIYAKLKNYTILNFNNFLKLHT